jgi:hypothetical protein
MLRSIKLTLRGFGRVCEESEDDTTRTRRLFTCQLQGTVAGDAAKTCCSTVAAAGNNVGCLAAFGGSFKKSIIQRRRCLGAVQCQGGYCDFLSLIDSSTIPTQCREHGQRFFSRAKRQKEAREIGRWADRHAPHMAWPRRDAGMLAYRIGIMRIIFVLSTFTSRSVPIFVVSHSRELSCPRPSPRREQRSGRNEQRQTRGGPLPGYQLKARLEPRTNSLLTSEK